MGQTGSRGHTVVAKSKLMAAVHVEHIALQAGIRGTFVADGILLC